jgi:hypothetical protein
MITGPSWVTTGMRGCEGELPYGSRSAFLLNSGIWQGHEETSEIILRDPPFLTRRLQPVYLGYRCWNADITKEQRL